MKEADGARATWRSMRKELGLAAEDASVMRRHHMHPHGPNLIDVLEARGQRYGTVLEIGTAQGVSAVILAHFCESVITIDVKRFPLIDKILAASGIGERVARCLVANNAGKKRLVDALSFDMAFIDGLHQAKEFRFDFDLTKRCGLLLCHDYPTWRPGEAGPGAVLDGEREGRLQSAPPFAWWAAR